MSVLTKGVGGGGKIKQYGFTRSLNHGYGAAGDYSDFTATCSTSSFYSGSVWYPLTQILDQKETANSFTYTFTFTEPQEIIGFSFWWGGGTSDRWLKGYTLSFSDDGTTYTVLGENSALTSIQTMQDFEHTSAGKHKYWKLYLNSNNRCRSRNN